MSVRVVIIDDDPLVRMLLTQILEASGIEVVGEGDDGDRAVGLVQAHHPDVLLMDVRMARVSGIDATAMVRQLPDPPGVVALTSFDSPATIRDSVAAGVHGFLAKDSSPEEITSAVHQVARGEGALSSRAARVVLERARSDGGGATRQAAGRRLSVLTEREAQVVDLVAQGLTNGEIATRMFLGETTIKTHINSAIAKLGVGNRVQLAVLVEQAR